MLVSVKTTIPWQSWLMVSFFCLQLLTFSLADRDFYEILNVPRSASTKEIRKAFKKLAVSEHPDKKTDDPKAHEKFLKITRAYEVLKDDQLRKKYDLHGEEGLKEDFQGGQHYESWSFYQEEFGIYDDDPEIITLSLSDFEQSVEGTQDLWFINFYSPHCSHCHHLAPTWREVARELDGVVRIGAVNCQDDWQICRMQGIRSYPSLLLYPSREKYYGERSRNAIVDFALSKIHAKVVKLSPSTFKQTSAEESSAPWVISVCHTDGDCMSTNSEMKVAAMLEGLVNVGSINCDKYSTLCISLDVTDGVYFYNLGEVQKGKETRINSLTASEIAYEVLGMLPDVTLLNEKQFEKIRKQLKDKEGNPWIVHFVDSDDRNLELRKIPRLVELDNIQVGRIDCRQLRTQCNNLHLVKLPVFLLFKSGGGHEFYYGRLTAHDVAAFAKDSVTAPLRALGPKDFPDRVVDSKDPWFVDFFAPWCPPCMRLLPEFRKASKSYGQKIFFGTVDCTIHSDLCRDYNIRSYPTTIFYNESVPHHYDGNHFAQDMVEFIEDTLHPPVEQLTPANFEKNVLQRASNEIWVVDFFAPWCGPCQQLAPEWRKLSKMFKSHENVHIAEVNCKKYRRLCQDQGVNSYPTMRLYPLSRSDSYMNYNGWHRDVDSLHAWVFENLPSKVTRLGYNNFYTKVMNSQTPWIIDFYASWCGHCQIFKPQFEIVAEKLDGIVHAGKVDCEQEFELCQEYGISAYPTVRLFLRKNKSNHEHGIEIEMQDAEEIVNFVKSKTRSKRIASHDEF